MLKKTLIASTVGALLAPVAANAAAIYTSEADFLTAAGGGLSFESFESPSSVTGTSVTVSDATFTCSASQYCPSFFGVRQINATDGVQTVYFATPSSATFTFNNAITHFGIDVIDLGTAGPTDLTVNYVNGSSVVYSGFVGGATAFVGVIDTTPFSSVTFSATAEGDGIDFDRMQYKSELAPATGSLAFNGKGIGHILYVPYFSTQEGNVTAVNIVNTDIVNGKVLKVRFRGASNSDDVYDFQVFLSPGDVWAAGISKGADGRSVLNTSDKSCTLPTVVNGAFIASRTAAAGGAAETREGYVEILTMADITPGDTDLYKATKHVKGVAPCTSSVLTALTHENAEEYMSPPTTGIMANWTIINVEKVYSYTADAVAIEARDASGMPAAGNLVYWDQRATLLSEEEVLANTADPLLRSGAIVGARYDLPDLSTPYVADLPACPFCQARALSDAITVQEVAAEFYNESSVGAATDWVISFPTRRYFAAVDYANKNTPVYNSAANGNIYFTAGSTEMGNAANGGKAWQLCSVFGTNAVGYFDREETPTVEDNIVISPGTPTQLSICGEVTVVGVNVGASTATFGSVARTNVTNGFKEGWGSLSVPSANGLPMLVRQFTRVNNTTTNVYYGWTYPARVVVPGAPEPFVPDL